MRICLIGNYYPDQRPDEGMTKVGFHLAGELSRRHDVLHCSVKLVFGRGFWQAIRRFRPQIVHYIPGASVKNLLLLRLLKTYCNGDVRTVTSVQQPFFSALSRPLVRPLRPDLALVQSVAMEGLFRHTGCRTAFLPNGVDTQKFVPASSEQKNVLRNKYGLNGSRPVALHVGPLRKWRNTDTLVHLQQDGCCQVVAVASTTNPSEPDACHRLRQAGGIVRQTYLDGIEEAYQLADCYVFPVAYKLGCVETPLSVLEAMACNLPVVTTRYGALPRLFADGDGLYYAGGEDDIVRLVKQVAANPVEVSTRAKASACSWETIAAQLEKQYQEVLGS